MFPKRMLLTIIGIVLLLGHAVFADTITVTQTTLSTEKLGSIASCGGLPCTTEVAITITNGTNKTWTDYSILFVDAFGTSAVVDIAVKGFQRGKPWSALSIEGDGTKQALLTLFKGSVPPDAMFTITVDLKHLNSVDVSGTPSTSSIPEPSTCLLFGIGLISLAGVIRRKLHA